jgi:hypothetical protein
VSEVEIVSLNFNGFNMGQLRKKLMENILVVDVSIKETVLQN